MVAGGPTSLEALVANAALLAEGVLMPLFALGFNAVMRLNKGLPKSIGSDVLLFWALVDLTFVVQHEHISKLLDEKIQSATVVIFVLGALAMFFLWFVSLT